MEINNSELQVVMPQSERGKETKGNSQKINSEPPSNLTVVAVQICVPISFKARGINFFCHVSHRREYES